MNEVLFLETKKGEKRFLLKESFDFFKESEIKQKVIRLLGNEELQKITKISKEQVEILVGKILMNEPVFV